VVSTGDSLDCSPEDAARLALHQAAAKEMEAAAIAQVCASHPVKLVLLKAITDFVDHPEATHTQFLRNYEGAVARLASGLEELVSRLTGPSPGASG
jgi:adenosylhomocysteine nucleosidase/5'-methylthioadenosine nucleosidase